MNAEVELRLGRATVSLIREANRLCGEELSAEQIPRRLLRTLMIGLAAERGALLQVDAEAPLVVREAIGLVADDLHGLLVPADVEDFHTVVHKSSDSPQSRFLKEAAAGAPALWARQPMTGLTLLLAWSTSAPSDCLTGETCRSLAEELLDLVVEIGERRLRMRTLRESEERYRSFVENMGDGAFRADREGKITYVNRAGQILIGVPAEQMIGGSFLELFAPESIEVAAAAHVRIIGGERYQAEVTFVNGVLAHVVADPLRDHTGAVVGVFGTVRDVTRRRQIEETFRGLVENSLQGLLILQGGTVVFANKFVADMLGATVPELVSRPVTEMSELVHPEDREMVWGRFLKRQAGESVPPHYAFRMQHRDRTYRWLDMYASRMDWEGKPAVQVALVDITDRVRRQGRRGKVSNGP